MNKTVLCFTSLSGGKISLYESLSDILPSYGQSLHLFVFDNYGVDFSPIDKIVPSTNLKTSLLSDLELPGYIAGSESLLTSKQLQNVISLEQARNPSAAPVAVLSERANHFAAYVKELLVNFKPSYIIRNCIERPVFLIVKYVSWMLGIRVIDYQAWAYPGTYQYSESLWRPSGSDYPVESGLRDLVCETLEREDQKRKAYKEKAWTRLSRWFYLRKNSYVLYLTGGNQLGSALKAGDNYTELGCNWGDEHERYMHVQRAMQNQMSISRLLIRQHPNSIPKIKPVRMGAIRAKIANQIKLSDLFSKADAIVCGHTTLVYHALPYHVPICVMGRHELENSSLITSARNFNELAGFLGAVERNRDEYIPSSEQIIDEVTKFVDRAVLMLDSPSTYKIFKGFPLS